MGRSRTFDEPAALHRAAALFVRNGYEATSVDDLVGALRLHRGSLYNAFGSKLGLFLAALRQHVERELPAVTQRATSATDLADALVRGTELDLLLVAAVEPGPRDLQVAELVRTGWAVVDAAFDAAGGVPQKTEIAMSSATSVVGARLYQRLRTGPDSTVTDSTVTEES